MTHDVNYFGIVQWFKMIIPNVSMELSYGRVVEHKA